jgi:hypothetical protein
MQRVIRVMDMQSGPHRVFLDLHNILPAFSPEGHAWRWTIRDEAAEITAARRWDLDMSFILEQLREPRGLVMSFSELEQFAARIDQVIWGEFIAAETTGALPRRGTSPEVIGRTALAGALAFDSSYWFVGGPTDMIARAIDRFEHVEEVAPEEWPALD